MYLGSWKIDDAMTFSINTHNPSSGAASDADSDPSYRVYEDETATPIVTGTMALLDSSNTDGFYSEQVTLSAASGFEKGKSYTIYVSAAVSGTTGTMSHSFQIEAEVDANVVSASNVSANVEQWRGTQPNVLVSNRVDSSVGAMAADTLTASALATDAVNEVVDQVWDETRTDHTGVNSFGRALQLIHTGTAQAGTSTTITLIATASATNSIYAGQIISIISGTGAGQTRRISGYTGSTKVASVPLAWTTTPSSDSVYTIYPAGSTDVTSIQASVITPTSIATNAITSAKIATDAIGASQIAANAITAVKVADGTIDAATFAANAIDSTALATSAVDEIVDQVWNEAMADHVAVGSYGHALRGLIVVDGTVESSGSNSTTQLQTDLAETTDDQYIGNIVVFTDADNAGMASIITDYTGATGTIVFSPAIQDTASVGEKFIILGSSAFADVRSWLSTAVTTSSTTSKPEVDAFSISDNQAAADNVQANIGNLDATVSSRSDFDETTDPVELLDTGGTAGTSASELVDDVWDEDIEAAHGTDATSGLLLRVLGAAISNRANNATLNAMLGVADTAGTDLPEQVWSEAVRVLTANTNFNDPTAAAIADAVLQESVDDHQATANSLAEHINEIQVDTNSLNDTKIPDTLSLNNINAEVDTALNTAIPGGPTANSINERIAAIDDLTQAAGGGDLAAILADTNEVQGKLPDNNIMGSSVTTDKDDEIDAIKAKTDSLTFTVANQVDSNIKALDDNTEAATDLSFSARTIVRGAAIAGTLSLTQMTTDLTEATDDHYNGRILIWTSGVLKDQATDISDYTGLTKLLTFTAVTESPSATDTFVIV